MKSKKNTLLFILLLTSVASQAAEEVQGQIVYTDRTDSVTFLIPTGLSADSWKIEGMQNGISYIDSHKKKHRLEPGDAVEFSFNYNGYEYRMVSHQVSTGSYGMYERHRFLLQIAGGRVKVFQYSGVTGSAGGVMPTKGRIYFLQRGDGQLEEPASLGFKKQMAEYFSDCPKLVGYIEDGEFKKKDLVELVTYYNKKCK